MASKAVSVLMVTLGLLLLFATLYDTLAKYPPQAPVTVTVTGKPACPETGAEPTTPPPGTTTVSPPEAQPTSQPPATAPPVTLTTTTTITEERTVTLTTTSTLIETTTVTATTTIPQPSSGSAQPQLLSPPSRLVVYLNTSTPLPEQRAFIYNAPGPERVMVNGKVYNVTVNATLTLLEDRGALLVVDSNVDPQPLNWRFSLQAVFPEEPLVVKTRDMGQTYRVIIAFKVPRNPKEIVVVLSAATSSGGEEPAKLVIVVKLPEKLYTLKPKYWYLVAGDNGFPETPFQNPLLPGDGTVLVPLESQRLEASNYIELAWFLVNGTVLEAKTIRLPGEASSDIRVEANPAGIIVYSGSFRPYTVSVSSEGGLVAFFNTTASVEKAFFIPAALGYADSLGVAGSQAYLLLLGQEAPKVYLLSLKPSDNPISWAKSYTFHNYYPGDCEIAALSGEALTIACIVSPSSEASNARLLVARLDSKGEPVWARVVALSNAERTLENYNVFRVEPGPRGEVFVLISQLQVFTGNQSSIVLAVNGNGDLLWAVETPISFTSLAVDNDTIYLAGPGGLQGIVVAALRASNATLLRAVNMSSLTAYSWPGLAVRGDSLYLSTLILLYDSYGDIFLAKLPKNLAVDGLPGIEVPLTRLAAETSQVSIASKTETLYPPPVIDVTKDTMVMERSPLPLRTLKPIQPGQQES